MPPRETDPDPASPTWPRAAADPLGARSSAGSRRTAPPRMITRARSRRPEITNSDGRTQTMPASLPGPTVGGRPGLLQIGRPQDRPPGWAQLAHPTRPGQAVAAVNSRERPPVGFRPCQRSGAACACPQGGPSRIRPGGLGLSVQAPHRLLGERVCTYLLGGAAPMITASRKQTDGTGSPRGDGPGPARMQGSSTSAPGTLRPPREPQPSRPPAAASTPAQLDIPGTPRLAVLHPVLGNPDPRPGAHRRGTGLLLRLGIGELPAAYGPTTPCSPRTQRVVRRTHRSAAPGITPGQTVGPPWPHRVKGELEDLQTGRARLGHPSEDLGHRSRASRRRGARRLPRRTETRQPPPPHRHAQRWRGRRAGRGSPSAGISPGRAVPPRWRHRVDPKRSTMMPVPRSLAPGSRKLVGASIVDVILARSLQPQRTCPNWPPS